MMTSQNQNEGGMVLVLVCPACGTPAATLTTPEIQAQQSQPPDLSAAIEEIETLLKITNSLAHTKVLIKDGINFERLISLTEDEIDSRYQQAGERIKVRLWHDKAKRMAEDNACQ